METSIIIKEIKIMFNYKLRMTRWIKYNIQQNINGDLSRTSSGHVNDILKLRSVSERKLNENGIRKIGDKFKISDLFNISISLFNSITPNDIIKPYNIVLCIFLKSTKKNITLNIKDKKDIISLIDKTPPEFIITKDPFWINEIPMSNINGVDIKIPCNFYLYKRQDDDGYDFAIYILVK
jgi:hypothetical protein